MECILETQKDLAASGLHGPLVGHVGDGNFHMLLILDPTYEAPIFYSQYNSVLTVLFLTVTS